MPKKKNIKKSNIWNKLIILVRATYQDHLENKSTIVFQI